MTDRQPQQNQERVASTMEGLSADRERAADVTGARITMESALLREQVMSIREASGLKFAEVETRIIVTGEKAQLANDSLSALVNRQFDEIERSRVVLSEGLLERIDSLRQERMLVTDALEKAIMARLDEYRMSHEKEHTQVERANDKLENTINDRFEAANNFRKQIESERIDYVRRDLLEQRSHATDTLIDLLRGDMEKRFSLMRDDFDKKLDPLVTWRSTQTGRGEISSGIWAVAAAIFVSLVVVAVQLILVS